MEFSRDLIQGTLVKRYKRFLADVVLKSGEKVTAHCPNTGAMAGLKEPGSEVWLSPATKAKTRKLNYTWELIRVEKGLVGINTLLPNKIVTEAILAGLIPELAGYDHLKNEVKYGESSRIDILLSSHGKPDCYVEIKNVHLVRTPKIAEFPDSVSARATKHQKELSTIVNNGDRAVTFYLCQREDCEIFRLAQDIDPNYAMATANAEKKGVEMLSYDCSLSTSSINLRRRLNIN